MWKIAILASGEGSNAEQIVRYFREKTLDATFLIISNKTDAGVVRRATNLHIPIEIFLYQQFVSGEVTERLRTFNPDLIVLAGFLLKIPDDMVALFPNKILNIHPALLPKFGGRGMYGIHVHQAVKEQGETETGITIHLVNEHYDEGKIVFQKAVAIVPSDTAEDISAKVRVLELQYYPVVIHNFLKTNSRN